MKEEMKTVYKVVRYSKIEEQDIVVTIISGMRYMDKVGGIISFPIERNNLEIVTINTKKMIRNGFSIPWSASISFPPRYNGNEWILPNTLVIDEEHPFVWERYEEGKTYIDIYVDMENILKWSSGERK